MAGKGSPIRFQRFGQRKRAEAALVAGLAAEMQTQNEIYRLIYLPPLPADPGDDQAIDVAITRA